MTRQPFAVWHTREPPDTGTQSRLQQLVPSAHGSPSTMQPPDIVLESVPQVPALAPEAMLQTLVQQSAPWKQMSPVALQPVVPPAFAHFPLEQKCEQQSVSRVQVLPTVVHSEPGTGWHVVPWQLLEQQSAFTLQVLPLTVQVADTQ
ncbi:MAG TPA: hypothetical protein VKE22_00140 [Haliangiales bacterium]|nr:hypothetical protein [Haliangiales bacterium]